MGRCGCENSRQPPPPPIASEIRLGPLLPVAVVQQGAPKPWTPARTRRRARGRPRSCALIRSLQVLALSHSFTRHALPQHLARSPCACARSRGLELTAKASAAPALCTVAFSAPVASTSIRAGQAFTIRWRDDGSAPTAQTMGVSSLARPELTARRLDHQALRRRHRDPGLPPGPRQQHQRRHDHLVVDRLSPAQSPF